MIRPILVRSQGSGRPRGLGLPADPKEGGMNRRCMAQALRRGRLRQYVRPGSLRTLGPLSRHVRAMFEGAKLGVTEGPAAVRRLVMLGLAVVALMLIGVAALVVAGSQALDGLQARQDRELAQHLLDQA